MTVKIVFLLMQVIDCIWKHPDARVVYLTCDLLGQEEILVSVCQAFGSKIFVDKENNQECFQSLSLTVPDILSQDPSSRFHIFDGYPRLPERAEAKLAEARANFQPEPLIIRASAQWYVFEDVSSEAQKRKNGQFKEAMKDQFSIWHVCYSIHSSRDELEWALKLLAPRWVVSTTPECRAMELSYVRRHCSYSNLAPDDPLWKLLDIDVEAPYPFINEDVQEVSISSSSFVPERSSGAQSESFVSNKEISTVSSPGKKPSVTLFGRARVGFYEDLVKPETVYRNEDVEVRCNNEVVSDGDVSEGKCEESKSTKEEATTSGLSKGVGENIRKLYRGMHVPVPKPLPSLVDLLNDIKRSKRKFMS